LNVLNWRGVGTAKIFSGALKCDSTALKKYIYGHHYNYNKKFKIISI
jgi:hypothetical protein